MTWIKGDTARHTDKGDMDFKDTHLIYLTDSIGSLIIDERSYSIKAGEAHVFNEGLEHYTINTGTSERLMIGPISENGFHVGGDWDSWEPFSPIITDSTQTMVAINYLEAREGNYDEGDITLDYPTITENELADLLNALVSVKYKLTIRNITSSVEIVASGLKSVGSLEIINNPGLIEISGFKSLSSVSGSLIIKNNQNLSNITGFTGLVRAPTIYIDKLSLSSLKRMPNIMTKIKKPKYYVIKPRARLTYKRVKGKTIRLAWSKPVYNPGIKYFRVLKATKAGSKYKAIKIVKDVNKRFLITTGVKGNLFRVLAINVNGSFSSNIITIKK
jgi:hypothetical protein